MLTANELQQVLYSLAPASMQQEWDNTGLLCGRGSTETNRVLIALDPTVQVAEEAKALGCHVVVTHHPVTFGCKSVTDDTDIGRRMLAYLENGIALISMHTNLDSAPGGVSDVLAQKLELKEVKTLFGKDYGIGRYGIVPEQSLADFTAFVKQSLGCSGLRAVSGGRSVRTVAVGGGSCFELLTQVRELGCDTFVTADVKYHQFCQAQEQGINLIDAGHFQTENPVCAALCEKLSALLPETEFLLSETHRDCIEFVQ